MTSGNEAGRGGVRVPHDQLDPDTLRRLLIEYVTRDGTDYGAVEASIDRKVEDVLRSLRRGEAAIVWDEVSATASIALVRDLPPETR